jgi:RNA polymerase sigma-70 factor (ECF subfamily)
LSTPPGTTQLRGWLDRIQAGDLSAREELLGAFRVQLEALARRMLRRFPAVARWEQTSDVLQNALLRLMRALPEVMPASRARFFGLAAEQMRRELLDLARHYQGPLGLGAHHASWPPAGESQPPEPADHSDDPEDLERWLAFHEGVAQLPEAEREAVDLLFYHGLNQEDAAALLGVSVRTLQRRWKDAVLRLRSRQQEAPQ